MEIQWTPRLHDLLHQEWDRLADENRVDRRDGERRGGRYCSTTVVESADDPNAGHLAVIIGGYPEDQKLALTKIGMYRAPMPSWVNPRGPDAVCEWYHLDDLEATLRTYTSELDALIQRWRTGGGEDNPVLATEGETPKGRSLKQTSGVVR